MKQALIAIGISLFVLALWSALDYAFIYILQFSMSSEPTWDLSFKALGFGATCAWVALGWLRP